MSASFSDWLEARPRVPLAHLPTPLEPLDRLSEALGGPRLWLKRDDCTGLATGGNKTRKLEFLLGEASRSRADTVITFGAVQSNHARQTAAACAKLGLDCHLVLARRVRWQHPELERSGNVLLDRLVGATVHLVEPVEVEPAARELETRLAREGRRVYRIPTGGSNATGALGYVGCARELVEQARAVDMTLDLVVHATSSGGTQAGLVVGMSAYAPAISVLGINVSERNGAALIAHITALARQTAASAGAALELSPIRIDHRFLGEDYGLPTPQTLEAMRLVGRLEGVIMDPVYSGKGFSGLIAMIRAGELRDARNVVFIHTGGGAVLPVYSNAL